MEQASFTVSSWQEQPIDNLNENFPVNQASATYQLSGALSGDSFCGILNDLSRLFNGRWA